MTTLDAAEARKIELSDSPMRRSRRRWRSRSTTWQKTAARYTTSRKPAEGRKHSTARAVAAENKRDNALAKYHHYEVASAAFQIGIVLASAAVITGMIVLTLCFDRAGASGLGLHGDRPVRAARDAFVLSARNDAKSDPHQPAIDIKRLAGDEARESSLVQKSTLRRPDRPALARAGSPACFAICANSSSMSLRPRPRRARQRARRARQARRDRHSR